MPTVALAFARLASSGLSTAHRLPALLLETSLRVAASPFAACAANTGANATILIPREGALRQPSGALEVGDDVAVLAPDGSCVGKGTWTESGVALTVWADDPFTEARDGLLPGEPLRIATFDQSEGTAYAPDAIEIVYDEAFGADRGFRSDGLYIVGTEQQQQPQQPTAEEPAPPAEPLVLGTNYPNPVRDRTTVPFFLGRSDAVSLEVFDALGRMVDRPLDATLPAGDHTVDVSTAGYAPGLYVYRLRAGQDVRQGRMTVVR